MGLSSQILAFGCTIAGLSSQRDYLGYTTSGFASQGLGFFSAKLGMLETPGPVRVGISEIGLDPREGIEAMGSF